MNIWFYASRHFYQLAEGKFHQCGYECTCSWINNLPLGMANMVYGSTTTLKKVCRHPVSRLVTNPCQMMGRSSISLGWKCGALEVLSSNPAVPFSSFLFPSSSFPFFQFPLGKAGWIPWQITRRMVNRECWMQNLVLFFSFVCSLFSFLVLVSRVFILHIYCHFPPLFFFVPFSFDLKWKVRSCQSGTTCICLM